MKDKPKDNYYSSTRQTSGGDWGDSKNQKSSWGDGWKSNSKSSWNDSGWNRKKLSKEEEAEIQKKKDEEEERLNTEAEPFGPYLEEATPEELEEDRTCLRFPDGIRTVTVNVLVVYKLRIYGWYRY